MMYSTRPTLPTDKQAHVKRDELPNPMCRRNRLDYCNILLAGSPKTVIDKLQRVMNTLQRESLSCTGSMWQIGSRTSSCLCRGCASNLELTVGWTAKPGYPQCHLPMQLKDVSVSTIPGALSASEALCDYALYKSTFTFTLHSARWRR